MASGVTLLGLFAAACSSSSDGGSAVAKSSLARNTSPNVPASDAATLSDDNLRFAFDLYAAASSAAPNDNFFFSPYSISAALSMAYQGARNQTAAQMASAAHFSLPPDRLAAAFDGLDLALKSRAISPYHANDVGLELHVVDSLWGDTSFHFAQPFLDTLAVDYGAGVRLADFVHAPDDARTRIDEWVSDETERKIPELLPAGSIDAMTRAVLVDAVYFKATWNHPFATGATKQPFHLVGGGTAPVDMMGLTGPLQYASTNDYEIVVLPYAADVTSMMVIVPREGALPAVEAKLADASKTPTTEAQVTLTLPKFRIVGSTLRLKSALTQLGMSDAFDQGRADFSGTSKEPVSIGDVVQQATLSVDERGTEAAAAAGVIEEGVSAPVREASLTVDRPFFVLIRDSPTNTLLFAGRVTHPE